MAAFLWLLLGCVREFEITYYADSCTDWEFDEETEPRVLAEKEGDDILVMRKGVSQHCDAGFSPEVEATRGLLQVFEFWEVPEDADDCQACFFPTVKLHEPAAGDYELQWFDGRTSVTPVGFLEVTVE